MIDEIDKSDLDLPNDLLHVLEEGEFTIPELMRLNDAGGESTTHAEVPRVLKADSTDINDRVAVPGGRVSCAHFPIVILTSNNEREMPPAFYRRCLRYNIPDANIDRLTSIVESHLGEWRDPKKPEDPQNPKNPIGCLIKKFHDDGQTGKMLANDQLLNAIFLIMHGQLPPDDLTRSASTEKLIRDLGAQGAS